MCKQIINWKNIEIVFLDMDGTLLDLHFDNHFWKTHLPLQYSRHYSIPLNEAIRFLHYSISLEEGTLNWYNIDYWSEKLGMDLMKIKRELSSKISLRPNAKEFLEAIYDSGRKLTMVTDAHKKIFDLKMEKIDLSGWFHEIIISHDLKAPKENPLFWQRLHSIAYFDPKRTLLIDDNENILETAHRCQIANLATIAQPDSRTPPRTDTKFLSINDFSQIMPI